MQERSNLYKQIISNRNHYFKSSLVVGEFGLLVDENGNCLDFDNRSGQHQTEHIKVSSKEPESGYQENMIMSIATNRQMFKDDPEIGQAIAGEINVEMIKPASELPKMCRVAAYVRACVDDLQSEWLPQGVYYIDTSETSNYDNELKMLTFHGYDAMMFAEQDFGDANIFDASGTALDIDIVKYIADKLGLKTATSSGVDSRTIDLMNKRFRFPNPVGYTLREELGYIASVYVGSFVITERNELRLVSMLGLSDETYYLVDNAGDVLFFGNNGVGDRITWKKV